MTAVGTPDGLVERGPELEELTRVLEAAADGRGSLVILEGEPGIGKTRLAEETAALARARGMEVLQARGHEREEALAFAVVRQLLGPRVGEAPAAERAALLAGAAGLAAPLLDGSAPTGADPFSLTHGLFWVVANLAERAPLLLVVDDVHLADQPSLRVLLYLAQRLEDLPAMLCLTMRPAGPGAGSELLPRLRAHQLARTLRIGPLSQDGVGALVDALGFPGAERAFVHACAQASGGNPFYLRELLTVLGERAVEATAAGGEQVRATGPRAVAVSVESVLGRLGAPARALARALALLGDGARPELVAALAGLSVGEATRTTGQLVRASVLRPGEAPAFAHPIVRAAVYQELGEDERAAGHARAARVLHEAGLPADQVAAHLLEAPPGQGPWAAPALREAADRALEAGEPVTAARLARRALAEPGAGPEALVELARAEAAAGADEAVERFEEALVAVTQTEARGRILLLLGRTLLQRGRYGEAARAFGRGLSEVGGDASPLAADLRSGWAGAALWDPAQGARALAVAAQTVSEVTEPSTLGERTALANLAGALLLRGEDRETAVEVARRAWGDGALLEAAGPQDPAVYAATAALTTADALEECERIWEALLSASRARGLVFAAATASYGRGHVRLARGRVAEAVADSEHALEAQRDGWGMYAGGAYWTLVAALLEQGQVDAAEGALALDPEREARLAGALDSGVVELARGLVALARGEPARALERFQVAGGYMDTVGWLPDFAWRPPAAHALAALGRAGEARALAEEQLARARRWGAPRAIAVALRARAAGEEGQARVATLSEAVALLGADHPAGLERAHGLVALGGAHHAAGQAGPARDALRRGLDLADRLGLSALAGRARGLLVEAGGRPRRARVSGAAALTPSELRVVQLAITGRTNREIAEDLFVTRKAVQWHLGNAYRKLGISGREELADALGAPVV